MNILMIGDYKPQVGGPAHVVQNIVNKLKEKNKIYVVNMEERGCPTGLGHWNDDGVEVYQEKLWFPNSQTVLQRVIQKTKRALLLRKKVDLYHAHGVFDASIGFIDRKKPPKIERKMSIRYIAQISGFWFWLS